MKFKLIPPKAILLVVDVQEKLFPHVDHACEVMEKLKLLIEGILLLDIPVVATEQYPKGLGSTIHPIKELLGEGVIYPEKTSFSVFGDEKCSHTVLKYEREQYIVAGIEAHICVLQTVKDLVLMGKDVVVVNDAITSRSIFDFSSAIAEMRDLGARISTTETVLFELFHDSKHPRFKDLSALLK